MTFLQNVVIFIGREKFGSMLKLKELNSQYNAHHIGFIAPDDTGSPSREVKIIWTAKAFAVVV